MITKTLISFPAQMYITEGSVFQVLVLATLGIIFAVIYTVYHKAIIGRFVNALLDAGAVNEESAVSLDDIGYENNKLIRSALKRNNTLIKNISQTEGKYYICNKSYEKLGERYNAKDVDFRNLLLTIVLLIAAFVIVWVLIPPIVSWLNSILQTIS